MAAASYDLVKPTKQILNSEIFVEKGSAPLCHGKANDLDDIKKQWVASQDISSEFSTTPFCCGGDCQIMDCG